MNDAADDITIRRKRCPRPHRLPATIDSPNWFDRHVDHRAPQPPADDERHETAARQPWRTQPTTPIDDDVLDDAVSVVALHKAAKQGELAAQTLLVFADGRESELATFLSNMLGRPVEVTDPARIRQMAAYFMSQDALNAPSKKARKAARRYLENSDVAPKGAVRSL